MRKKLTDYAECFFKYDPKYFYYLPVDYNNKFFYGIAEDDFIVDGYSIRKICDLKKVEIKKDKTIEFIKSEKVFDNINPPEINLTDWKIIFEALQKSEKYIIVEKENLDERETIFAIGRIIKINKTSLLIDNFDADGEWDEVNIPFTAITSVTFQSRYVSVWAKYLD